VYLLLLGPPLEHFPPVAPKVFFLSKKFRLSLFFLRQRWAARDSSFWGRILAIANSDVFYFFSSFLFFFFGFNIAKAVRLTKHNPFPVHGYGVGFT